MSDHTNKVRTPLFPLYSEVCQLMTIFDGMPKAKVTHMINSIREQTGTPQNPVDWSDPDTWITERLSGDEAELALRTWTESNRTINPRYVYGSYLFINTHKLMVTDEMHIYHLTELGAAFLNDDSDVIRDLDDVEGLLQLLTILSTKPRARRKDMLPEWGEFLHEYSKFGSASTIKDTLRRRLQNLIARRLISREGSTYTITPAGKSYLETSVRTIRDQKFEVMNAVLFSHIAQMVG